MASSTCCGEATAISPNTAPLYLSVRRSVDAPSTHCPSIRSCDMNPYSRLKPSRLDAKTLHEVEPDLHRVAFRGAGGLFAVNPGGDEPRAVFAQGAIDQRRKPGPRPPPVALP